jgi:TPR repeat protein
MIRRIAFVLSLALSLPALAAEPALRFEDAPLAVVRVEAEGGDAAAQFELANRLFFGQDVAEDRAAAVPWYRKAAEQGHTGAAHAMGLLYHGGRGVTRDEAEATKWWKRGAELGDASSQYWLGSNYEHGMGGLPLDVTQAERWYRKSAEQGNPQAQVSLGDLYAQGEGVQQSDKEAVAWYRKAADQREATGLEALGAMYATGRGVVKDEKKAFDLYSEAADQGFDVSMVSLGNAYARGQGTPKNPVCAYFWIGLAGSRDFTVAKEHLEELARTISPADLADAKRMIAATTVPGLGPVQRPFCPGELISISVTDAGIVEVMAVFRQVSGYPIVGLEKETRSVTVKVNDVTWESALTETLKGLGYRWAREGDTIRVTPIGAPGA